MTPPTPRETVLSHDCGWTSRRTTSGTAAYALRRHSCEKQQRINESAARGRARAAAVDRRPKPCLHKIANHAHGTYACYVLDTCRCRPCAKANADYETRRVRQIAYGRYDRLIDAAPARAHVEQLMAAGLGLKRIARLAGISTGAMSKLIYGTYRNGTHRRPSARITKANAEKLFAVHARPDTLAGGTVIDATGTRRRVQALVVLGWSQTKLGIRIGMNSSNFCAMVNRPQISARTARLVAELYEQLWDTPPPETNQRERIAASRSRRYAAQHGWLPPLAWDDETIDDPTARPLEQDIDGIDEMAVVRIIAGTIHLPRTPRGLRMTPELVEAIRRMALRMNDGQIAQHISSTADAVLKIRQRNNISSTARRGAA